MILGMLDWGDPEDVLLQILFGPMVYFEELIDFFDLEEVFAIHRFLILPVAVFATLFLLDYLPWPYVALTWIVVVAIIVILCLYGDKKERRARNPLYGILTPREPLEAQKEKSE